MIPCDPPNWKFLIVFMANVSGDEDTPKKKCAGKKNYGSGLVKMSLTSEFPFKKTSSSLLFFEVREKVAPSNFHEIHVPYTADGSEIRLACSCSCYLQYLHIPRWSVAQPYNLKRSTNQELGMRYVPQDFLESQFLHLYEWFCWSSSYKHLETHQKNTTRKQFRKHGKNALVFSSPEPRKKKNDPTFHYTDWLIGILTMVYYSPYVTG